MWEYIYIYISIYIIGIIYIYYYVLEEWNWKPINQIVDSHSEIQRPENFIELFLCHEFFLILPCLNSG